MRVRQVPLIAGAELAAETAVDKVLIFMRIGADSRHVSEEPAVLERGGPCGRELLLVRRVQVRIVRADRNVGEQVVLTVIQVVIRGARERQVTATLSVKS